MTMTLVSTVTVGAGGVASISFTGIAGTATDLLLVASIRDADTAAITNCNIQFNSSTSGYTEHRLYGTGSSASANTRSGNAGFVDLYTNGDGTTASSFSSWQMYIPNYAGSTYKSTSGEFATETNSSGAWQGIVAGLWSNTSAITSIQLTPSGVSPNLFKQYTSVSLYTITKGSGGATVS